MTHSKPLRVELERDAFSSRKLRLLFPWGWKLERRPIELSALSISTLLSGEAARALRSLVVLCAQRSGVEHRGSYITRSSSERDGKMPLPAGLGLGSWVAGLARNKFPGRNIMYSVAVADSFLIQFGSKAVCLSQLTRVS